MVKPAAGPLVVLEGSARYTQSYTAWHRSSRDQSLDTYLEALWGNGVTGKTEKASDRRVS